MNILKKIGSWFDTRDGASSDRIPMPMVTQARSKSIEDLIKPHDQKQMMALSRKIYSTSGPVKGAIDSLATYAVGKAMLPISQCSDSKWAAQAKALLEEQFYTICDVRGMVDFQTGLWLMSVSMDRDADGAVLLTETDTGFPQLQYISAFQINSDNFDQSKLQNGPYKGLDIYKGVITNSIGRPVAYRINTKDGEYTDVSARDLIFYKDFQYMDQVRGIPAIAHGINQARTIMTAQECEEMATQLAGAYSIVEHNETGTADPSDPRNSIQRSGESAPSGEPVPAVTQQSFFAGMIKYFKAGTGGKLEFPKSERPGDAWEKFNDRLIRMILAGMGIPYELAWKCEGTGPGVRLQIGKASRAIEDRQSVIIPIARRIIVWAIAKFIKRGDLEAVEGWYKWDFTLPSNITIDAGRDGDNDRKDIEAGVTSVSQIIRKQGGNEEQIIRDKLRRKKLIKQLEEEEGEAYDDPAPEKEAA